MNRFKILSVCAYMAFCMGFVSCNVDEPCDTGENSASSGFGVTNEKEVDLGLPSGTIWAGWNVGATAPEESGCSYVWGELEEFESQNESTYDVDINSLPSNISGTQYDVARYKWGGNWRMPTKDDWKELFFSCISFAMHYKGVNGCYFIGPNGNSIFLPIVKVNYWGDDDDNYFSPRYWTANKGISGRVIDIYFEEYDDGTEWEHVCSEVDYDETYIRGVRPVKSK